MFSRKSTIIATIFIAFMYLVPVSVFAAGNGTIVVIAQDTSKKQIATQIYVDSELMGTGVERIYQKGGDIYKGIYKGRWSLTCPNCGNGETAAGKFTAKVAHGVFKTCPTITTGNFGIPCLSGTVSSSGAITATAPSPPQCSSSVGTFIGKITTSSSVARMTGTYSRPASPEGCAAEFGTMTATRRKQR